MATDVQPPRGMRDLLPADQAARTAVLAAIRAAFSSFGYREIETPALEDLARLEGSDGGDNTKLIFRVQKRGLDPTVPVLPGEAADLGLRYDLTVPLARFYATHRAELPAVFRAIQIAPVWRGERPARGRYRQFTQCDIDVLGEPGPLAEVELIVATLETLRRLGVTASVRLNDRAVLDALLAAAGVDPAARPGALVTVDKLDKIGLDGVAAELAGNGVPAAAVTALASSLAAVVEARRTGADATGAFDALPGPAAGAAERLRGICAAVATADPAARLVGDPTLVRGQGYYTGPIFELEHPDFPGSIGGGGRYDGMIGRFAGADVAACGFSLGFERLVELVDAGRLGRPAERVALVHDAAADPGPVVAWQRRLVATGAEVRLVRRRKNLGRLLDELAAEGFAQWVDLPDPAPAADAEVPPRRPIRVAGGG